MRQQTAALVTGSAICPLCFLTIARGHLGMSCVPHRHVELARANLQTARRSVTFALWMTASFGSIAR
jgi:hypothetical protein